GRQVALKVLPGAVLANDPLRKRFEREARIAGKLHHSNIVPIFGVGEHQGVMYYAMQFITGVGLDQLLHELRRQLEKPLGQSPGTVTPPWAGESGWQVAALAHALAEGRLAGGVPASEVPPSGPPAGRVETSPVKPSAPTIFVPGQPRAKPEGAGKPRTEVPGAAPVRHPPKNPPVEVRRSLPTEVAAAQTMIGAGVTDEPTHPEPPPTLADSDPNDVAAWRIPSLAGGIPAKYFPGVARIGVQLASALHYAHSHNVLHRDIKPANLMVDSDGNIWITDFGLAKATDQGDLTVAGDVLGTYRYMAPEALAGRTDAKSDVYSLGLTLFEMLVLKPAFPARERRGNYSESTSVTVPRIDRLNPAIPRDLATIVQKAVEAEPSRRYQTAGELGDDLQRFLSDEPILARRISPIEHLWRWAKRHRTVALAVATVAVLLVTFSVVMSVMNYRLATRTEELINERKRADDAERKSYIEQVERLMVASPATVPELISSLKRAKVDIQEILVERLASTSDPAQKLRLLAALTALGTSHAQELCELTPSLPHSDAQIVLPVLRSDRATVLPQLLRQFKTETNDESRAHIACALLELGEFEPAGRMLALGTD
ncbi:MAG: protein kinase, partial [Planctomycetota bacterium]|nr:protein kinase [Planctomycetota bacterium]